MGKALKKTVSEHLLYLMEPHRGEGSSRFLLSGLEVATGDVLSLGRGVLVYEPLKTPAEVFEGAGITVCTAFSDLGEGFDGAILCVPKSTIEAKLLIAQTIIRLKAGGFLICGAGKDAGGGRIQKILAGFGLQDIQTSAKYHAKFAVCRCTSFDDSAVQQAITEGDVQHIASGRFWSMPGVFGWDKIDRGSEMLASHIPDDLAGKGADFGCGYGYLSDVILKRCEGVKEIICADYDARALKVCEQNLGGYDGLKKFVWADLSQGLGDVRGLDFIVMNPPFHEGKDQNIVLGQGFIRGAAKALREGGRLFMVANAHLPYEDTLHDSFKTVVKLSERQGFKAYEAVR